MRVKLLKIYAGPDGTFAPGDVAEINDERAEALIKGRFAEKVEDKEPEKAEDSEVVETAQTKPAETTLSRRGKKGRNQ